jgi:imidazole glycerol phosphate synthase subunit HisF
LLAAVILQLQKFYDRKCILISIDEIDKIHKHLSIHYYVFIKQGANKYMNHENGEHAMIPRHAETDGDLCILLCKQLEIPLLLKNNYRKKKKSYP